VGGHPLGGGERGGFAFARPDLFAGRPWIFTPEGDGVVALGSAAGTGNGGLIHEFGCGDGAAGSRLGDLWGRKRLFVAGLVGLLDRPLDTFARLVDAAEVQHRRGSSQHQPPLGPHVAELQQDRESLVVPDECCWRVHLDQAKAQAAKRLGQAPPVTETAICVDTNFGETARSRVVAEPVGVVAR